MEKNKINPSVNNLKNDHLSKFCQYNLFCFGRDFQKEVDVLANCEALCVTV